MNPSLKLNRSNLVVGFSVLLVAIVLLYSIGSFWAMRQGYDDEIDRINSRTARLLGLMESQKELAAAADQISAHLRETAYADGADTATVSAAMQQLVRDVMSSAGLSVSSSQILPAREIEGFVRLSLDISVVGNIDAVEEAIANLGLLQPLVLIESTTVKPVRSRRGRRTQGSAPATQDERNLSVRLRLLSLRLLP